MSAHDAPNAGRLRANVRGCGLTNRAPVWRGECDDVMTDEQYLDYLFSNSPVPYADTPGFRAFVLDLMDEIGERPREGDVSSMHLAYKAGMEQAQSNHAFYVATLEGQGVK